MLHRILIFTFSFLFLGLYGQEELDRALKKADKLLEEEKFVESLEVIESVLEKDALYLDALEKKVNIYVIQNKDKDILNEINEKIEENIQQPEYYYLRGIIYIYRSRPGKAIQDFNNAEYYQMPEKYHDRLFLRRGVAYYNQGEFYSAEVDYRAALDINGRYATVYHSWGMLDYERGMYDEAIEKFTNAIKFGDERPVLYYNLAMSYLKTGDKYNACYYFHKACMNEHKNACKVHLLECSK